MNDKINLTPFEQATLNAEVFVRRACLLAALQQLIEEDRILTEDYIDAIKESDEDVEDVISERLCSIDQQLIVIAQTLGKAGITA